jgi:hypothetical protein
MSRHAALPERVGSETKWVDVSAGDMHASALRRDGTLWRWGDGTITPLGNSASGIVVNPTQLGTNHDWAAVQCGGSFTVALRSNGTAWYWGRANSWTGNPPPAVAFPTQLCRETNWVGFAGTFLLNNADECWLSQVRVPDAKANISSFARQIGESPTRAQVAFAPLAAYEIREDGTLWRCRYRVTGVGTITGSPVWRRVGTRSDWVSVTGYGTVMGLTRDGTIWCWGADVGREPVPDFQSRLTLLKVRLRKILRLAPMGYSTSASSPIIDNPAPLMRIEYTTPTDTAHN